MKIEIPEGIKGIMHTIKEADHKVYVCGGAVRDSILHGDINGWDLVTNCPKDKLLELFPEASSLDKVTILLYDVQISEFRLNGNRTLMSSTIQQHCDTCDFTINALCADIKGEVYDFVGGMEDLQRRVLKFVGSPYARISEDPLRALRAIRFMAKYTMQPEYLTNDVLHNTWGHIAELPRDRIRDEFIKVIAEDGGINLLAQYRVVNMMIPEFNKCMIPGGPNHNELVLQHLVYSLESALEITDDYRIWLAALLHDVGKPLSQSVDEEGKVHFYDHDTIGATYVKLWMKEYEFSQDDINFVSSIVEHHMWLRRAKEPTKRSYIKHFKAMRKNGVDLMDYIKLTYCDHQGNMAHDRMKFGDFLSISLLPKKYYEYYDEIHN